MADLPSCVRCGHAFERHVSWNACRDCTCIGYSSVARLKLEQLQVGDELEVAGGYYVGVMRGVVIAIEAEAVVLRLADGREDRFGPEDLRNGRVRRLAPAS